MFRLVRNPDPRKKPPYGNKLDPTHPLSQGLVGCWLLNEGGGDTVLGNLADNRYGVDIVGSTHLQWISERAYSGIHFDTNYRVAIPNTEGCISPEISIVAYCNYTDNAEDDYPKLLSKGNHAYAIDRYGNTGNPTWTVYTSKWNTISSDSSWLQKDFLFTGTFENGESKLYHDNIFIGSKAGLGSLNQDTTYKIAFGGNEEATSQYGMGNLYFVYLYNRAILFSEVNQIHAEPYAHILIPQYWYMVDFGAAVTSSLVKIINEELQFNEATLKLQSTQKVVNETLQLSESVEKKGTTKKVINETLQISESTTKTSGMIKIISETLQIAESFAKISGITKVVNEALQLSESISRKIGITKIVNETLQLVEGIKKLSWTTKIINETLRFNEALFKRGSTKKVINETLQISETTRRLTGITKIINETLQIAESLAKITGITKVVNETLQLSESVLQKTGITKIINETLQISEKIKKLSWTTKVVNETLQLSETLFKKVSIKKIINETLQLSENIARKSGLIKIINEVLNIGEKIIRTLAIALGWREVVKGDSRITTMITGDSRVTTMITGDSPLD